MIKFHMFVRFNLNIIVFWMGFLALAQADEIKIEEGPKSGLYFMIPQTALEPVEGTQKVKLSNGKRVNLVNISKYSSSISVERNEKLYRIIVHSNQLIPKEDIECVLIRDGVVSVFTKAKMMTIPQAAVEFTLSGNVEGKEYSEILDAVFRQ